MNVMGDLIHETSRMQHAQMRKIMYKYEILTSEDFKINLCDLIKAKQIVLFGAGELAYFSILRLDYLGIKNNVVAIVDNNRNKIGGMIEEISIISIEELKEKYSKAMVLITVGNKEHQNEILHQLKKIGIYNLTSYRVMLEPYQFTGIREPYLVKIGSKRTILKSVVMSITTKCSLKCKHCSYLMPYFNAQQHIDKNIVIKSVKILSKIVDTVNTFALVGGEPFLHPELNEICEEVGKIQNIKFKNIITNGTIIPKIETLQILNKYRIAIFYSDYGDFSTKKQEIEYLCKKHDVLFRKAYNTLENSPSNWFATEYPEKHNRNTDHNVEKYAKCSACNIILNGEFYICVYGAFGTKLNAIPKNASDYVDLLNPNLTLNEIKNDFEKLLIERIVLTSCDYCPAESRSVPIAEQVDPDLSRIMKRRERS